MVGGTGLLGWRALEVLEEKDFRHRYAGRIDMDLIEETWLGWSNEQQAGRLYNNILQAGNIPAPVHRIHRWPRYAAAAMVILLAGVAIYLASRAGDYVVGNAIAVDGGIVYAHLSVPVSGGE